MPQLQGPRTTISYRRDDLGYPAIDATNLDDAMWARGWFHAYDRLVQVQLALAVAGGRAMELMGDIPLARYADRMTRLHRFTDDLDAQVAKLTPETRRLTDEYCAGFNAGARERGWPLLLRAAKIPPRPYAPRDVLLTYRIVAWFGLNQLAEMASLIASELAVAKVSPDTLGLLLGDAMSPADLAQIDLQSWPAELSTFAGVGARGSNGVALAGTRSASGGALLAADPHLEINRIPPVLYATHASHGEGEYMQGLHIPGFWFASFGRTRRVAWTYTYGRVNSVDIRSIRCRQGQYHDGTSWRALTRRTCVVAVKGKPAETWTFWDTDTDSLVGDAGSASEVSLPSPRWSGIRETYADLNAASAILRARDVDEVVAAHRTFSVFCLDGVFADAGGRIARVLMGRKDDSTSVLPRPSHGAPVPADEATRPVEIDPPHGWIVSANARPRLPGGRAWAPLPDTPARVQRLSTLADAAKDATLSDLARMVMDTCDAGATRILAAWAPLLPDHPRARQLAAWASAQPGSGPEHWENLTLWVVLHEQTCRLVLEKHLGPTRARHLLDDLAALQLFRYHLDEALALERPQHLDEATLRGILADAFPRALARSTDPEVRLPRRDRFKHAVLAGKLSWLFDSTPIENRGGPTTPNQVTSMLIGGQRALFGSAGRYLCDLSRPGGWYTICGGASERRFKVGYGQGLEDWAQGRFRPLGPAVGQPPGLDATTPS